jgi:hypothetical protein
MQIYSYVTNITFKLADYFIMLTNSYNFIIKYHILKYG